MLARDEASKILGQVDKSAQGLGKTLGDVGKIAGGFLAGAAIQQGIGKLTGFIGESVSAASNLQQAVGGVNSVFKENAAEVLDWGENNAANFGLSKRAFAEMAGPLGAMLKNSGMDMSMVTDKTIELTKRAADMAATFGGTATDALTAISAALRGETDPIERYGVSMNAAKVEAEALAMTGKTLASSLTDQEKAAARLSLLFKQTADAEGQSAREADTHAGATARATARMEDMQAQIGTKLLPITVKLTEAKLALITVIAEKVIPYLEELWAVHGPAIVKAFNDILPVLKILADNFITRVEGMIQVGRGIVELIQGTIAFIDAVANGEWARAWEELKNIATGVVDIMLGQIKATFGSLPGILYDEGRRAGSAFLQGIKDSAGDLAGEALGAVTSPGGYVGGKIGGLIGRAGGGPVSGGMPYIVGERGPELFVPGSSGSIVPNQGLGGGNVYVTVHGSVLSERDIVGILRNALQRGELADVLPAAS